MTRLFSRLLCRVQVLIVALWAGTILCGSALAGSPTLIAQPGVTAPASIPELARALKYDVNLIYEYVYTNIDYSPTYGLKKGALGTLLDGHGNDFDQSALLVSLLRASGYTANYTYGQIRLSAAQVAAFYGVDATTSCPIQNVLTEGGIPFTPPAGSCGSHFSHIDISHTWVTVTGGSLGSTTYVLDPSYKQYASEAGISLPAAMGYNQATFLSSAETGSTISPGLSVQNLNTANIASSLTTYANNLVAYIRAYGPTATTRDLIGGNYIQPLAQPYSLPTSLSYETPGDMPLTWTDVPAQYRTTLEMQIGGVDLTYYGDDIYGHRLTVVYNSSSQPVLYLDGVVKGTGSANAITLSYAITFPYCFATAGPSAPICGSGQTNIFSFQNTLKAAPNYTFAIVAGWDFTGRGMVDFHRQQLQVNTAAGNPQTSEAVLGEALNMIGYSWLSQNNAANAINDRLIGSKAVTQCAVGVVAQVNGPYIDIPGGFLGVSSLTNDTNRVATAFTADAGQGSAQEWGTLAQNLARIGVSAVSTVKLIDLANSQGNIVFAANSSNWSAVQSQLIGYAAPDLSQIATYISQGYQLVLPQRGNLTQGLWSGVGYIAFDTSATELIAVYKISSNLKGGYSDDDVDSLLTVDETEFVDPPIDPPPQFTSNEPIDLSSGGLLYDHDDLSVGSGNFPINLTFHRSYNSNNLYQSGPLGAAWTHSLAINAAANSDGLKGLGQDSPIDGAAAIAAAYVVQDLFSDATKPLDKVVVATLVQKWLMDRLITNTVNVAVGAQTEQFVLLADGSYNPQLGSSDRLTLTNGFYTLQNKDSTTLNFDADGNASTWKTPAGLVTSFTYDTSTPPLLTSVSNGLGRSLTLAYNGSQQLAAVSDNASPLRTVNYGYDSKGNLVSFTDPLGNTTQFTYTPTGGGFPAGLLSQIFYPSNPTLPFVTTAYDSLGRVTAQTNANGSTWNYFFAGYRSEEDDSYGTQHVLYYNPRGKAQFDIQDYAGRDLVTTYVYDGLDRLFETILPEGGGTVYFYDGGTNPWANNVAAIFRVPKPSSPLPATETAYIYDPLFNKPTAVVDALGRVKLTVYDRWTGNPASVTMDAGTAPHFNARTRYTYNALGLVGSTTDPMGVVTTYAYDGLGNRLTSVADAGPGHLNQTTTSTYNARGDVISTTDPKGNVTTGTYDANRRQITKTAPPTSAAPAGLVTTNTYDADGRLLQAQQSANGTVLRTSSSTYTPSGKVATATDANGNVTRYAYDLLDRQSAVTDAMGRITQFTYDALSHPYQTFNPAIQAGPLLQLSYTADGKVASRQDANGNTTSFAYDGVDRLATITYPLGTTKAFTWDALDNPLTRKTRAGGTVTFAYDTLNRRTSKTPSSGPVVSYTYDLDNRSTGVSDTSTSIAAATPPGGSTVAYTTSYAYDAVNRLTGATWDPAPAATAPAAGSLVTFTHSYNKVNQRVGQTVSDNSWISYPATTPVTTLYAANALNQYTTVGAASPTYDANGNLTADGTYALGYDGENRLTSSSGAGNTAAYAFDAQGRRKSRTVNGATTISVTDADGREVLEYDGATGALLRWYSYALSPNGLLNQMNVAAATRATFLPDQLGSIIAAFDSSSGGLTKTGYQAYGTSASVSTPFGYTGQRFDPENTFYYYRARNYSTAYGRFLQTDPSGAPSDARGGYSSKANLYVYALNDPLNRIDATGMASDSNGYGGYSTGTIIGAAFLGIAAVAAVVVAGPELAAVGAAEAAGAIAEGGATAEAGAVATAETGATPFAMGLDSGLDAFAEARGATTWKDFEDPLNWQSGVINKLADPNTTVHFNLDNVDVWQGISRAAAGNGGATDWELSQIYQNPQWWDTTQFWQNGILVPNPFAP